MIHAVLLQYDSNETGSDEVSVLYRALSPSRKAKADSFKNPEAFKASVFAGRLLEKHLARLTGLDASRLTYEDGGNGRPVLPRTENTAAVDFNISHTDGAALAVFKLFAAGEQPLIPCVGCDVERLGGRFKRPDMPDNIINRFFAGSEQKLFSELAARPGFAAVRSSDTDQRRSAAEYKEDLFFRFWTAKEAHAKMTGRGISGTLGRETVVLAECRPGYGSENDCTCRLAYSDGSVLISGRYPDRDPGQCYWQNSKHCSGQSTGQHTEHCSGQSAVNQGDLAVTVAADRSLAGQPFVLTYETIHGLLP